MTRFTRRAAAALVGLAVLALPAAGQQIQWGVDLNQAFATAQKNKLPLLLYVQSSDRDRDNDTESAHNKSFRDPTVIEWTRRFVAVKLSRSRYRKELTDWGVPTANQSIVFVSHKQKLIDQLSADGVAKTDSLVEKMRLVFKQHRTTLFNEELRPKLEGRQKLTAQELETALAVIRTFLIVESDAALVKLLERTDLEKGAATKIYAVLAELSTKAAVDELLKRAVDEPEAEKALARCTPEAAERLLPLLDDTKEREPFLLVYRSVTKICKLAPKSDKFWDGTNQKLKNDELERVRTQVRRTAKAWALQYAQFR